MNTVVLVEGLSDRLALEAAAALYGRDLTEEGVGIVAMGGATNLGHFISEYAAAAAGDVRLAGLCDLGEQPFFGRTLERAGIIDDTAPASLATAGFFVCERDLEDELIRAVGFEGVEAIIEAEGELDSFRSLQQMPFHRRRAIDEQLHRFMGVRSGRKYRYAPLLVQALDAAGLPPPLCDVLAYVA